MLIRVCKVTSETYGDLAGTHEKAGLSPAPSMKGCSVSHLTFFSEGKNARENTQDNWAACGPSGSVCL